MQNIGALARGGCGKFPLSWELNWKDGGPIRKSSYSAKAEYPVSRTGSDSSYGCLDYWIVRLRGRWRLGV